MRGKGTAVRRRIERQMDQYINGDRIVFHKHAAAVSPSGDMRLSHNGQAAAYSLRWTALSSLFSWVQLEYLF